MPNARLRRHQQDLLNGGAIGFVVGFLPRFEIRTKVYRGRWVELKMRANEITRERDIDAALETASRCREDASIYRQLGFDTLARWLTDNAKAAERWASKR